MKISTILLSGIFALSMAACAHGGKGHHKGHEGHGKSHSCKHGKKWEKMDANSDGSVSKAEFEKAGADKFAKMDANKDGKVTKEEKMAYKKAKHSEKKACCK